MIATVYVVRPARLAVIDLVVALYLEYLVIFQHVSYLWASGSSVSWLISVDSDEPFP